MEQLPRSARVFLSTVVLAGFICLLCGTLLPWPHLHAAWYEPLIFVILAIPANGKKIHITPRGGDEEASSMSLGFALTFAAMLRFGISWTLVVALAGCLASCLYPNRQRSYQITFNLAGTAIEVFGASVCFLAVNHGSFHLTFPLSLVAVSLSAVVDFLINTGLVAGIIGLCTEQKPLDVWNQHFSVTAPSYFYGAWIATAVVAVLGKWTPIVVVGLAPVAILTLRSFKATEAREVERQKSREELAQTERHISELYLSTIKSLALAIDAKDPYTHQHILRVQRYAMAIARQMRLHPTDLEGVNTGALLHDIGKIGVPEYVLLKPGRLTNDEYDKIKEHPTIGAAILDPVAFPWPVLPVVKYHHEKWDGTGYPEGLKGEQIPLTARILAVADVYDALTSTRSYRGAWSHERAVALIRKEAGTHFDRGVVEAFLEVIEGVVEEMAAEGTGPLIKPQGAMESADADRALAQAAEILPAHLPELFDLLEIERRLPACLGLDAILQTLASRLTTLFPGVTCALLLKRDDGVLAVRATVGTNREFFEQSHSRDLSGPSAQVAGTQATYNGPYDPDDILFESKTEIRWSPLASALIAAICYRGETLGTVNLYHSQEHAFSPASARVLETIAAAAGPVLFEALAENRVPPGSEIDPITGLHNLRYLLQYSKPLFNAVSVLPGKSIHPAGPSDSTPPPAPPCAEPAGATLLCLAVDDFRSLSDVCGRDCANRVLRELGSLMRSCLEGSEQIARMHADQFVVLRAGADAAAGIATALRVQQCALAHNWERIDPALRDMQIRLSYGVACSPAEGEDLYSLYRLASERMYYARAEYKLCRVAR